MTTLAKHIIVVGAKNRPPMLEKSMYNSWASRIRLFITGKKHGRMMLDSIENGPLVYPTVEEDGQIRPKKYLDLTEAQQLQDDCDVQATNIILHDLPPGVYALVNHQKEAKDIWDKVKLLMKGTELSYQERECRLCNLFDKFASVQVETLYEYCWRFSQLINDMHTNGMTMQQVQFNTKFLNALPLEWSKFVTDVKLAKSLYTTNYDQLYAYLSQHERHANEVRLMRERYLDPFALVANSQTLYNPFQSPQHSVPSMHPPPQQFIPVCVAPIHHQQHHTPVNPLQQSVSPQLFISPQPFKMEESQFNKFKEDKLRVLLAQEIEELLQPQGEIHAASQPRVVKCYNCQGEGHMARQCTQPKKLTFQTEDLDACDSDCDDISSAKAVLMVNLSSCGSDVLSEVQYSDTYPNDMINQDVQEMPYFEQTHIVNFLDNEINSDSNIIPYS
ncbi:reverse transcriptase domain-containing protein [Tanacetum coccineum]